MTGLTLKRLSPLALILLVAAGCATGPAGFRPDSRFRKNIVRVSTFVDKQTPWVNFEDPPRNVPGGVKLVVYLTASGNPLGVFGDGQLLIDMYRVDRGPDDAQEPVHLHRWSYNTEEAYQFGFLERQRVGWGYQLRLNWGDADVLGKEVMFIVSFERYGGHKVRGKRMFFKVPRTV